jgi:hypothetical protein
VPQSRIVAANVKSHRLAFLLSVALVSALPLSAGILPLSEVKKGMKGYGLTVFDGSEIERFDVEIIGVLHNSLGPGQSMILASVEHPVIRNSGVIAGMSGSPIFIDGKVIGALAYGWQFAKDPVAGITPIEEMLAMAAHRPSGSAAAGAAPMNAALAIEALNGGDLAREFERVAAVLNRGDRALAAATPIATPLSFSGFSTESVSRFTPMFERAGFMAVPSGSSGKAGTAVAAGKKASDYFRPGDAIGAVLVDGDLSLAANGTVTWIDGDRVLAFGHPFLEMGEVSFPMTTSDVVGVLPNLARSFKFSNTGTVVGALQQDRAPGILGVVGAEADMVPVEISLDGSKGPQTFNLRVVQHAALFPLILAFTTDSVITSMERGGGERSLMLDMTIEVAGQQPLRVREGWSGAQARQTIPMYLAVLMNFLTSNEFAAASIERVKIDLRHFDDPRSMRLMEARVEPPANGIVRPGDTVRVHTLLRTYRGGSHREVFEVEIPANQTPGKLFVTVGNGTVANQVSFSLVPADPQNLTQLLGVVRRLHAATDLTVSVFATADGFASSGNYYPSIPPSMAAVRASNTDDPRQSRVRYDTIQQHARPLGHVIEGSTRLEIDVRSGL